MRKILQRRNDAGRSMVEMLGVLAIIGILSVAGIMGFKTAMTKHRANEIMRSVSIANQNMQWGQGAEYLALEGVTFQTQQIDGQDAYTVVTVQDKAVCELLKTMASGQWIVEGDCT